MARTCLFSTVCGSRLGVMVFLCPALLPQIGRVDSLEYQHLPSHNQLGLYSLVEYRGKVMRKTALKKRKPLKRKTPLKAHKGLTASKPLNQTSKKRRKLVPKLADLYTTLRRLCHNRSELSGRRPDWRSGSIIEPHHIGGRNGDHLLNPFEIIELTDEEHEIEQQHLAGCHTKEELLNIVRPIRLAQGFKEEK